MSKNKIKLLSKLVKKKTTLSLKLSLIIFNFMLILLSIVSISLISQYYQLKEDFFYNDKTHIIEITSKRENNKLVNLQSLDEEYIKTTLNNVFSDTEVCVSIEYSINFGIPDSNNNTYFIYMLNDKLSNKLGLNFTNDFTAIYTRDTPLENITLKLPKIIIENQGYSSSESIDFPIKIEKVNSLSHYLTDGLDKLYISEGLYTKIINEMFDDNSYNNINRILIYVTTLSNVDHIADIINSLGFNINYTLESFNDLSKSLNNTLLSSFIILSLLLIVTSINLIISSEIYLKNNQKDMGIFKHYGYTTSQVYSIYKNNFHTLFFKSFMITEGFSLLFLIFLIKKHIISIVILITLSLLLIIYIVNLLIILRIKYFTEKSTINLLKFSKESE